MAAIFDIGCVHSLNLIWSRPQSKSHALSPRFTGKNSYTAFGEPVPRYSLPIVGMKLMIISNGSSRRCDPRHIAVILVRRWELLACVWNDQVNVAFFVDRAPFVVGLSRLERHWPVACGANRKSGFLGSHKYLQKRARGHNFYSRSGISISTQKIQKSSFSAHREISSSAECESGLVASSRRTASRPGLAIWPMRQALVSSGSPVPERIVRASRLVYSRR